MTSLHLSAFSRRAILFFVFLLLLSSTAWAQTTLTGKVTDAASGQPLPGVTLLVVGKQLGAVTGADGNYRLSIATGSYQIRASFVGYKTQVISTTVKAGKNVLDVALQEDLIGSDEVVVLGTRRDDRVVTDSPVPIDVITPRELQSTGATETMQVLQAMVPSYNAPQSSITDGTDHIKVATLRGLAPDQMLVLVNGKRQHTSALVNVNGSVGRGSTGIDMNSIPASIIERVEVLRDGAAAQYGSDAIAGVINLVLKQKKGLDVRVNAGQYLSNEVRGYTETEGNRLDKNGNLAKDANGNVLDAAGTYNWDGANEAGTKRIGGSSQETVARSDGQAIDLNLGYGLGLGENGSLYIAANFVDKAHASRAGLDPRRNYFGINADGTLNTSQTAGTDDPREATFDRNNFWYGNGEQTGLSLFFNGNMPLGSSGANLYAFGGYSNREGLTGCFFRPASDNRTIRDLYPNGFLPKINGLVTDYTLTGGFKGTLGNWSYDLSEKFGSNTLRFNMKDVANVTYGASSPTQIDSGALSFAQATTNLDLYRQVNIGTASPLSVALGGEFRWENYQILQGQEVSYKDGGQKVLDGPNKGAAAAVGCQCFPGFAPNSLSDAKRNSFGAYADLENNVTDKILLSLAGRFENYSDFGSNFSGKFATKIDITENLGLRGAVSTGFRAPSLQQQYFTTISTNFINGVPFEVGTFTVNSPVAKALGATELKPETSFNLSAGITYNAGNFAITVDAYQIDIKDRITFTENFTGTAVQNFLATKGINANGGRFFTNAIDTRTQGLDVTARYATQVGSGKLRVSAALNFNQTEITNAGTDPNNPFLRYIPATTGLKALGFTALIGRQRLNDFEDAQPSNKQTLTLQYDVNNLGFTLRAIRYGEVTSLASDAPDKTTGFNPRDQVFSAKTLFDAEVNYKFRRGAQLSIGSNNILDVYPDKVWKVDSNSGILPYSAFSPFGFMGRYVYSRLSYSL